MKTTSATENRRPNSPMESSSRTRGWPPSGRANADRRMYGMSASSSLPAVTANRSGFRGARISISPGWRGASCRKAAITASSSSTSPAAAGGMVLAAIQTWAGCTRSSRPCIGESEGRARGSKSYLKLPATRTFSGGAPRARKRWRISSDCASTESSAGMTAAKKRRQGR